MRLTILIFSFFITAFSLKRPAMISRVRQSEEISKLRNNKYFDNARITKTKSLEGFNLDVKQIVTTKKSIRTYVLSDIHADAEKNQVWVRERCVRSAEDVQNDVFTVFVVPGDIGSEIDRIESVLRNLVSNYDAVCYLPGNHEAWRKGTSAGGSALLANDPNYKRPDNRMAADSVVKLIEVVDCARALGVHVGPLRVQLASQQEVTGSKSGAVVDGTIFKTSGVGCNGSKDTAAAQAIETDGLPVPTQQIEEAAPAAVLVVPLYGWYHSSWDTDPDITDPQFLAVERSIPFSRKWGDYAMCTWPAELISQADFVSNPADNTVLAEVFAKLNEPFLYPPPDVKDASLDHDDLPEGVFGSPLAAAADTVISYSHYLPRLELCPEKRFLTEPMLAKVIGSDVLESQVRRLQPHLHLYGHTHIPLDLELEGIRYLQWPLGYFREAQLQCAPIFSSGPLLVHDTALGAGKQGFPPRMASESTAWSKHYRSAARDSSKVNELAPWVRARLEAFAGMG